MERPRFLKYYKNMHLIIFVQNNFPIIYVKHLISLRYVLSFIRDWYSMLCWYQYHLHWFVKTKYRELILHFELHLSGKSGEYLYDESECELLVFGFIAQNVERNKDIYIPSGLKQMCKIYFIGNQGKPYCCICRRFLNYWLLCKMNRCICLKVC